MRRHEQTKPCEYCGQPVTKTASQQSQRKYWTCNASCANKLRIRGGAPAGWAANPLRGRQDTRPCEHCGKPVTRYLSQRRLAQFWTCSRACSGAVTMARRRAAGDYIAPTKPRRGETTPCEVCGTPVYRRPHAGPNEGRYCSVACHNVVKRTAQIINTCAQCGVSMRLPASLAHRRYCSKSCEGLARIARPLERTHNGRPVKVRTDGYVMVWEPSHPNRTHKGWQFEHRLVLEQKLGRLLTRSEHAHHVNGVKHDNRPENLEAMDGRDHASMSGRDYQHELASMRAELAEYRRRFGPLEPEAKE